MWYHASDFIANVDVFLLTRRNEDVTLRGQSIDNQYPRLLRLMARNDDCDF